jgi:ribosomal protein S11
LEKLYFVYFVATKHNLFVAIKTVAQKNKFICSGGRACLEKKIMRFVRQRRDACEHLSKKVKFRLLGLSAQNLVFYFYGKKAMRRRFISSLLGQKVLFSVLFFGDMSKFPHNGCREEKKKNRKRHYRKKKKLYRNLLSRRGY